MGQRVVRVTVLVAALLLTACVRVEVQRTVAPDPAEPRTVVTPSSAWRQRVEATPTTAPAVAGSDTAAAALRRLFRYRMPPPTALRIERLGIDVPVEEVASVADERGWYWPVPEDAAAHLIGTANPGEPGNIAITGHVDTQRGPGVFWRLLEVQPGDEITVWSAAGSFRYRVTDVRVVPQDDRSVLRQSDREVLTLLTCVPDGRYDRRLVVRAEPERTLVAGR